MILKGVILVNTELEQVTHIDNIRLGGDETSVVVLDQTQLPNRTVYRTLREAEEMYDAIRLLRVRGAPAIGICAAYSIYALARQWGILDYGPFAEKFRAAKNYLSSSRPTAVNLSWARNRMEKVVDANPQKSMPEILDLLGRECRAIHEEDIAMCRAISECGLGLLKHGDGILTHCNAGTLATAKYGTATAPMYVAQEHGWTDFRVYCDETRPLLQGARLTAFELHNAGIDTTLICDNMASITMKRGLVNIVFVGCDRVTRNGDAANKIGTSGVAILAKHYGIPFYVCAPSSTIDMSLETGDQIPIEERAPEEVTEMWYRERMAPEGVKVCNPAFDVTDHSLITGIITEKGLCKAPFDKAFEALGIGK